MKTCKKGKGQYSELKGSYYAEQPITFFQIFLIWSRDRRKFLSPGVFGECTCRTQKAFLCEAQELKLDIGFVLFSDKVSRHIC